MDLIDKQHIALVQVGKQTRQIARLVEHRARCHFKLRTHLIGDDTRQRGLTQTRRAVQQHVIERLSAHQRCANKDMEILDNLLLTREIGQLLRSDTILKLQIALDISHIAIYAHKFSDFLFKIQI